MSKYTTRSLSGLSLIALLLLVPTSQAGPRRMQCHQALVEDLFDFSEKSPELLLFEENPLQPKMDLSTKTMQDKMAPYDLSYIWNTGVDPAIDFLRLIGRKHYEQARKKDIHGTEVYGEKVFKSWRRADDYLFDIPQGKLELSVDLFKKVHELSTGEIFPTLHKLAKWIPDGFLPSRGGILKKRDSVGKDPIFHPLDEKTYQTIKENPWLGGFIEMPAPFSRPGKRRGFLLYAKVSETEQKLNHLISWYNQNKGQMDPVDLAAEFQRAFVSIHPFIDGNGRTSRLLLDRILWENNLPPSIVEDHNLDVYLNATEYSQKIREGIQRYLTYFEDRVSPGRARKAPRFVDIIGTSARITQYLRATDKPLVRIGIYRIGSQDFEFQQDGFFYSRYGVPYRYHEGAMYPINDRAMWLYEKPSNQGKDMKKPIYSPIKEAVWKEHYNLIADLVVGLKKEEDIEIQPYSIIQSANNSSKYYFYGWQKEEFRSLVSIQDTDPLRILSRSYVAKTEFEEYLRSGPSGPIEKKPILVLAQYEMMDLEFYEYQKIAEKMWPDLVPTILQSREKLHGAGRELMKKFFQDRNALSERSQQQLHFHGDIRIFDLYYSQSKLSQNSLQEALLKFDDRQQVVLRSDSFMPKYVGFRAQGEWSKMLKTLPFYERIRDVMFDLNTKWSDQKYVSNLYTKIQEYFDAAKAGADPQVTEKKKLSAISVLPKTFQEFLKTQTLRSTTLIPQILRVLKERIFTSRYVYKSVRDEMDRNLVDYMLHAGGSASNKEGISFSTNLSLYLGWGTAYNIPFAPGGTDGRIYLVRIPKNQLHPNYGSVSFPLEYEVISDNVVASNKVIASFKASDFSHYATKVHPDLETFFMDYFDHSPSPQNYETRDSSSDSR